MSEVREDVIPLLDKPNLTMIKKEQYFYSF